MRSFTSVAAMQPLRQAASKGNFQEFKRLCKERGVNVNEPGPETGRTALHWGAFAESNEIVSYLLNAKNKADVDPVDTDLDTPLNVVIQTPTRLLQKKLAVVETLLAHNADATRANIRGQTPLMNLIQLREALPDSMHYQLKNLNAVIARIKQDIYIKAHERGQSVYIYPNGQVIPEARAYNVPVPVMNNHYLPTPAPRMSRTQRSAGG